MTAIIVTLGLAAGIALAEEPIKDEKNKLNRAVNLFAGRMLPYGVYGSPDILPYWGLRYGHEIWGMTPEYSVYFINALNTNFYTASLSLTFPDKLGGFTYLTFFGLDTHYYNGHTDDYQLAYKTTFGFHFGCSPIIEITDSLALRTDFKLNFKPGLMLNVGAGLSYSF